MPVRKNWIMLLKNKAFKDKATELKINNIDIDKVDPKKINQNTKCIFKCNCGELGNKILRDCVERNDMYCKKCTLKKQQEKKKITNDKKNKDEPTRQDNIKKKKLETFNNTIEKKNNENPNWKNERLNKFINTCLEKYGVQHSSQSIQIKDKTKNTCIQKYGVKNPMQVDYILDKAIKNKFQTKNYILPSGIITQVQGYEPIALDELFENNYKEDDIITQYQGIEYEFENNTHKYYADIYIKSENKIIEVKSDYTMELHYDKNMAKWEACVDLGYEFEFWIYDGKKNKEVLKL